MLLSGGNSFLNTGKRSVMIVRGFFLCLKNLYILWDKYKKEPPLFREALAYRRFISRLTSFMYSASSWSWAFFMFLS